MTPKRTGDPRAGEIWAGELGKSTSNRQGREPVEDGGLGECRTRMMGPGGWGLPEGDLRMRSGGDGWGMKDTPAWGSSLWLVVTLGGVSLGSDVRELFVVEMARRQLRSSIRDCVSVSRLDLQR